MENREKLLLSKYYDVDEENRLITISYKYDSASDIIDDTLMNKEYLIKTDVMNKITQSLKNIPAIYKTNINIKISNLENYDKKQIVEAFNDSLEMNHYSLERENKRKWITTSILIVVGIIILFFNGVAKTNSWYGTNDTTISIASEVFDIIAWVFVWEAITVMFLTPTELPFNSNKLKLRVKSINFYDDKDILIDSIKFEIKELKWDSITRLDVFSHRLILIGGAALIGIGFCGFIRNISQIPANIEYINGAENKITQTIVYFISFAISIFTNIFEVLAGVGTLSNYAGHGPFKRISKVINYILIVLIIFALLTIHLDNSTISENIVTYIIYIIFLLGFIIEKLIDFVRQKKNKC